MGSSISFYTSLGKEALICARCGYCRSVCPVYQVIGWESSTPRGKISVAKEIFAKGHKIKLDDNFVERLSQCTLCGACSSICSTCIDTRSLWLDLRKEVADANMAPEAYVKLRDTLLANKNISTFPNEDRLEWAEDLDEVPDGIECRHGADVCYFVGCVSSFYPQSAQIPLAVAEILTEAGIDFTTMGGEEWCCGYPLVSSGFVSDSLPFIKHNVAKIKELGIHTLIASCATCYHFWKHECAEELDGYELEVLHTTEYLARLIKAGKIELDDCDEVITYHDPCDLGRNGGVFEAPREIIRSIPGAELVELKHNRMDSVCCGGGGNLQSFDPKLAGDITAKRIEEIKESGAGIVVSACQQCEQMLGTAVRQAGLSIRVMDVSELILEYMV